MDIQTPKRERKARQRHMARKQRRRERSSIPGAKALADVELPGVGGRAQLVAKELSWRGRQALRQAWLWQGTIVLIVVSLVFFVMSHKMTGRIYPNVRVMGVDVGGMKAEAAADALREAWLLDVRLDVVVDGEVFEQVSPQQIGLQLDAAASIEAGQQANIRQGLFGTDVPPIVNLTDAGYLSLQDYLLNLTPQVNFAPYNAGYRWQGDQLVGVEGRAGRLLDIAPTLAAVQEDPSTVVRLRRLNVFTSPVQPEVRDPSPYIAQVQRFADEPFTLIGYDPYQDTTMTWQTDRDTLTSWIELAPYGITLREDAFAPFIDAQTRSLNEGEEIEVRYMNVEETIAAVRRAIENEQNVVNLRVRYNPQDYVVQAGDTASKIARKTGIPFYLIQQHNPGRDLDVLSIGDRLNMPTRDVTMPNTPVPHKRIIVDLSRQYLWAYENGQLVFEWEISSGRSTAPTSPGIYQILSHTEKAYGGSYTMCDSIGCDQWEMDWFMGIYEVVPGLVNGFHGAVLLPNGAYLNGGATGFPSTFGCIMSYNDDAKLLYDWAEVGTVVEIISPEFEPLSVLAKQTLQT